MNIRWAGALTVGLMFSAVLPAGEEEPSTETEPFSLQYCISETNDQRRLQCFDRWAAKLMRDGSIYVPVVGMRMTQAMLEDEFGMRGEVLRKAREERERSQPRLDRLEASVVRLVLTPDGALLIELNNGQAWEQTAGRAAIFLKPGDNVAFTRGTLGTFFMTTNRLSVRVRRIR
jgi:hypothetical protein